MHAVLIRVPLLVLAIAGLSVATTKPANGDTQCTHVNPATGVCIIYVDVPGTPAASASPTDDGPQDTGSGAACFWDPSKQGLSGPPAGPVPCTSAQYGYWSNDHNCYVQAANPQPATGDPGWQGHKPADGGAVYSCYQPPTDMMFYFWSANPPPGAGAGPTPRQVAQLAIKQMGLSAVEIGIAPKPGANSIGLVGMPVWMWAQNPSATTVGPITASATAGGMTITDTATLLKVTWDMGDGNKVVCKKPGTAYQPSFGLQKSPDCGYVYMKSSSEEPGQKFTVSATSDWAINWSGAGQTGTIRLGGLTRTTQITIGEAQVLVD